jgi:hypothetical protein
MNGLSLVQNVEGSPRLTTQKLHGRAFYESIGSPKMIVAPMVDRSEFVGYLRLDVASTSSDNNGRPGECSRDHTLTMSPPSHS